MENKQNNKTEMAEDLNYDIGLSGWDEFIYKGWDMDEKNSYDLGI